MSRRITNRGGVKCISLVSSERFGGAVWAEGTLERDFLRVLADDPQVDGVQAQPFQIRYTYDAQTKRLWLGHHGGTPPVRDRKSLLFTLCYPDFLVRRHRGRAWLVEVWGGKECDRLARKAAACKIYAGEHGFDFSVLRKGDIRTPKLQHAMLRQRYARTEVPYAVRARIFRCLEARSGAPIACRDLALAIAGNYPEALCYVYSMVARGAICTADPSEQCLSPLTDVTLLGGA